MRSQKKQTPSSQTLITEPPIIYDWLIAGDLASRIVDGISSIKRRANQDPLNDHFQEETQIRVCDINPNMAGIIASRTCILCGTHNETHDHIFFQCSYSSTVWETFSRRAHIQWPTSPWHQLLLWAASTYQKGKDISTTSSPAFFCQPPHLRQERNRRIFNDHFQRLVNSNEYVMS